VSATTGASRAARDRPARSSPTLAVRAAGESSVGSPEHDSAAHDTDLDGVPPSGGGVGRRLARGRFSAAARQVPARLHARDLQARADRHRMRRRQPPNDRDALVALAVQQCRRLRDSARQRLHPELRRRALPHLQREKQARQAKVLRRRGRRAVPPALDLLQRPPADRATQLLGAIPLPIGVRAIGNHSRRPQRQRGASRARERQVSTRAGPVRELSAQEHPPAARRQHRHLL
jgi:hypothetical protein